MNETNWKFYRSVIDGEELRKDLRDSVAVKDPIYQQDHMMGIYEISDGNVSVTFAAGEFSNLVWGIYLLKV